MADVSVNNTTSALSGKTLALLDGDGTVTGLHTFNRGSGSAPFAVNAGAAAVTNLDADKLDGEEGSAYHNATNLSAGTVPTARLGSGSATASTYLRGDQSWASVQTVDTVVTSTSTGVVNDFAPGLSGHTLLRMNNATLTRISGFASGSDGQRLTVVSIGAGDVQFIHQGGTSSAANRIINFSTSGEMALAAGVGAAIFEYDGTTARWRMVSHDQGDWITPAYADSDYTGPGGDADWVVGSLDVTTCQYYQIGRVVQVVLYLVTTTTASTPATLRRTIPGSFTSAAVSRTPCIIANNGGAAQSGMVETLASDSKIYIYKDFAGTGWANGTDNNNVLANFFLRVT